MNQTGLPGSNNMLFVSSVLYIGFTFFHHVNNSSFKPINITWLIWAFLIVCNRFLSTIFYPPSFSEVIETPELGDSCTHTSCAHKRPHSYFTSRDVQNLSPASAPLTVGKGKNPSPSPWVCISLSKRWVTAIGLFVATFWDSPCLFRFDIWTVRCRRVGSDLTQGDKKH